MPTIHLQFYLNTDCSEKSNKTVNCSFFGFAYTCHLCVRSDYSDKTNRVYPAYARIHCCDIFLAYFYLV